MSKENRKSTISHKISGTAVKEARLDMGLSIAEASRRCGINRMQYQGYEQGRTVTPKPKNLIQLAKG